MNTHKLVKKNLKMEDLIINGAMDLDQWEQGAVRHHNEGQSLYRLAWAAEVNICDGDGDVDVDAGEQMG